MEIRKEFEKTYINLLPPPPPSLKKLPDEEIKEVIDYIFTHAKQTHKLIKEDAERSKDEYKELDRQLARSSATVILILLLVIAYLAYKLHQS